MSLIRSGLLTLVLAPLSLALAMAETEVETLRAYGPGGPHHVLQKCAELYRQKSGIAVEVIKALPHDLARRLPLDGDIYYGGAEYMLHDFNKQNPGTLNMETAQKLKPRRIGIIVRKGNPLNIQGIEDLSRDGVRLLDVKLEKMRHFYGNPGNELRNVKRLEYTGQNGVKAWLDSPEIDAWVTYETWYAMLSEQADFIEIPGEHGVRHLPMALTTRTPHQQEALEFIRFLESQEAHEIFNEHGWM